MMEGQAALLPVAGVLVLIALLALLLGLSNPRKQLRRRAKALGNAAEPTPMARIREARGRHRTGRRQSLDRTIARAGLSVSPERLGLWTLAAALALTLLLWTLTPFGLLVAVLLAIAAALFATWVYLKVKTGKRIARFLDDFPDAIGLIVRGLRAGLPLGQCIRNAAEQTEGPVGEAMTAVTHETQLGRSLEEALTTVEARLGIQEFGFFCVSLIVQRQTGGNLAETLDNLSDTLRKRRQLKLKIKALSGEARASALIIGALPFVVAGAIAVLSPDYVKQLYSDPRGQKLLMGAGGAMLLGFITMARMIRFKH